jgi:thymidylate synthase
MYLPIQSQQTCVQAWLAAVMAVHNMNGHEAYNVIIDIENPIERTEGDEQVIELVDSFLRSHGEYPVATVINTIFPYELFLQHGTPDIYDRYQHVYDRIKKPGDWGRYFHRMIYHETASGKVINPLDNLVKKVRRQAQASRTYRHVYELSVFDPVLDLRIYDPDKDAGRPRNRQCLSFLSFKLHQEKGLMLTAMYRNHYYIARGLGNFIGLGRLQEFIANEAGVSVGPLTCISTHAEVDRGSWNKQELDELLHACTEALQNSDGIAVASASVGHP